MGGMAPGNPARFLLSVVFAALSVSVAVAGDGEALEPWQRMSPEERRQMRDQVREHWARMSPEEREAHIAARKDRMRERLSRMSPEERERMRAQLRDHRHRHGGEGQVESGP